MKRSKASVFVFQMIIVFCLPMGAIIAQEELGVIESAELNPQAVGIKECGVTTWVKQNLSNTAAITKGSDRVFSDKTPEIFWFAQYSMLGALKNNNFKAYKIQWIAPSEQVFLEESFKSSIWSDSFVKRPIRFDLPIKDEYIGRWRVRVWKKKTLIDDRYFKIVRS